MRTAASELAYLRHLHARQQLACPRAFALSRLVSLLMNEASLTVAGYEGGPKEMELLGLGMALEDCLHRFTDVDPTLELSIRQQVEGIAQALGLGELVGHVHGNSLS